MGFLTIKTWVVTHWILAPLLGLLLLGVIINFVQMTGVYAGYVFVVVAAVLYSYSINNWMYLWVFLLGMTTAFTEIIGKFHDEPLKTLRTKEALIYHVFNGLVSMFALYVLILYSKPLSTELDKLKAVITAGLGAMLFMRSRLFNVKVDKEDLSFGPEQFVKAFMSFMEQAISRVRAQKRIDVVKDVMDNIKASAVKDYVITMLGAFQIIDNRDKIKEQINDICSNPSIKEQYKAYDLGYLLLEEGEDFVKKLFADKNAHREWLISAPRQQQPEGLLNKAALKMGIKPDGVIPYFAYGENISSRRLGEKLNWSDEQMRENWDRTKRQPVPAILQGHQIVYGKMRINDEDEVNATIVPKENEDVEGVLYWLPPLAVKYLVDAPYVPKYRLATIKVKILGEDKFMDCQTFLSDIVEHSPPSSDYLRWMIVGANEHGLSNKFIDEIESIKLERE